MTGALSVGQAAARLGVAASTLRTWERRYGVAPSGRSAGGHRRYSRADLAVLDRLHHLTLTGESPARAALIALREAAQGGGQAETGPETPAADGSTASDDAIASATGGVTRGAGPGGRVLTLPRASAQARGLARAAAHLDVDAAVAIIESGLGADGVGVTYDQLIRPVLVAAGEAWARTGSGVEIEHLFSEATIEALRNHRRSLRARAESLPPGPPVLLACAPRDHHVIPLHVLAAALEERSVPSRTLGSRVPPAALAAAILRTRARAVFVWAQVAAPGLGEVLTAVPPRRPAVRVVVGGPGWVEVPLPDGVQGAESLSAAVDLLS
jgi:hypothetical protein